MTSLVGKSSISLIRIAIYAVLILVCVLYLVPLVVMLLTSFKTPEDIGTGNLQLACSGHGHWLGQGLGYGRWLLLELDQDHRSGGTVVHRHRRAKRLRFVDVALPWIAGILRSAAVRLLPAVPDRVAADVVHAGQNGPGQYHHWSGVRARSLRSGIHHTILPKLLRQRSGCFGQGCATGWGGLLHDFREDHPADVDTDRDGLSDLAVHPNLERFPVRRGVFQW